jgi:Poly-adenylate binding protein, unique domain
MANYEDMNITQLGELVYAKIINYGESSGLAGKITGMILQMDLKDIATLLKDKEKMDKTYNEAKSILN